ncbi:MAG: hypothetical protein ABIF11_03955 [Nitrospirota bacterium]
MGIGRFSNKNKDYPFNLHHHHIPLFTQTIDTYSHRSLTHYEEAVIKV